MKEKTKDLKHKLQISSLAALTSATVLASSLSEIKQISEYQFETPHIAYVSNHHYKHKFIFAYLLKAILMVPLWLMGSILLKLLEPLKSFIISFLFTFIILSLIVLLIAKLLFPNLKIKDILSLKNIFIIAIFSLIINFSKYILIAINQDLLKYTILIYFVLGLSCLIIILLPLIKMAKKISDIYKTIS